MGKFSPDDITELTALIKVIVREVVAEIATIKQAPLEPEPAEQLISVGAIVIDDARHEVTIDGKAVDLAPQEYALLLTLAKGAGRAYTRTQLLELAWPTDAAVEIENDRSVDVHVSRLRKHLGSQAGRLRTVVGTGYKLDDR